MTSGDRLAHPCPWPGCSKAYKRLDHLERHQKSHSGDLNYRCHLCHRQYSRSIACVDERVACDGVPPKICSRCRDTTRQCRYRHLEMEAASPPSPRVSLGGSTGSGGFEFSPLTPAVGLAAQGDASEVAREGDVLGLWPESAWSAELIFTATDQCGFPIPPEEWCGADDGVSGSEERRPIDPGDEGHWGHASSGLPHALASPEPVVAQIADGEKGTMTPSTYGTVQALTQHAHRPLWSAPPNFPSESSFAANVHLFHQHFATWLPLLDPSAQRSSLLFKAMAGIGSVYAREPGLMELVRRDLLFIREHDYRFTHVLSVLQATLLTAIHGAFSASATETQHAETARATLVVSVKRMDLLTGSEEQRRLGWCIYLFDAHMSALFGLPPLYSLTDIDAPLPSTDASFPPILCALLESGAVPPALDDMAFSVLAFSLHRICADVAAARVFGAWEDDEAEYALPVLGYAIHPQALLDQLARHALRVPPTPLSIACAAVAYHAHLRYAAPRFMDDVKMAAGREGPVAAEEARVRLARWMRVQPRRARDVMAHASMLFALMGRFEFYTPPETVWIFDATLCMWAFMEFAPLPEGETLLVPWSLSPALEAWVSSGVGCLAVEGIGRVDACALLNVAAERLNANPWGLAARHRRVLLRLGSETRRRRG
ncbi:unnamed protein product [Cutaneotrichosporon oleaginosum]